MSENPKYHLQACNVLLAQRLTEGGYRMSTMVLKGAIECGL